MPKIDLSGMSLEELNALIDEATILRDEKVEEKRAALLKELQALDAMKSQKPPAGRQRSPSKYTHRHPVNSNEWLGRGGVPKEWQDIVPPDASKEERSKLIAPYRVKL